MEAYHLVSWNDYSLDELKYVPQKLVGKLFLCSDWKPEHLRVIYQLFDNDIGDLPHVEPQLVSAYQ